MLFRSAFYLKSILVLATSGVFCVPFNGSMLYNKKLDRNDGEKKNAS